MNFDPVTIDEMPTYEEWCAMAMGHLVASVAPPHAHEDQRGGERDLPGDG